MVAAELGTNLLASAADMPWQAAVAAGAAAPLAGVALSGLRGRWRRKHDRPSKPNVLFIAIDDLNDWVSPLGGHPQAITPNFERLAARGVTFKNAHCASPVCHPSRLSVWTGIRPCRSEIYGNDDSATEPMSWKNHPVYQNATTMSQHFRDNGYRAVGGGKLYHTLQWIDSNVVDRDGWDDYFPSVTQPIPTWARPTQEQLDANDEGLIGERPLDSWSKSAKISHELPAEGVEGSRAMFGWQALDVPDEITSDQQVVDWAKTELSRHHDDPFFLACGLFRPHIPWEVPREWFDLYPLDEIQLPEHMEDDLLDTFVHSRRDWHQWVQQNDQWKRAVQGYLASISYMDHQVGRLLDALEESTHADNTYVMLWSDHGMHIGEKDNWEKFTLWEESTHVPMMLSGPGIEPGQVCTQPASLLDMYPTLCELAGIDAPAGHQLDGVSMVPAINVSEPPERFAVTNYIMGHAIRSQRYRYIWYHNGVRELYDHDTDSGEYENLAYDPAYREVREWLHTQLCTEIEQDLPLEAPLPDGYEITADHRLTQPEFKTMSAAVIAAKEANANGDPIRMIGIDY